MKRAHWLETLLDVEELELGPNFCGIWEAELAGNTWGITFQFPPRGLKTGRPTVVERAERGEGEDAAVLVRALKEAGILDKMLQPDGALILVDRRLRAKPILAAMVACHEIGHIVAPLVEGQSSEEAEAAAHAYGQSLFVAAGLRLAEGRTSEDYLRRLWDEHMGPVDEQIPPVPAIAAARGAINRARKLLAALRHKPAPPELKRDEELVQIQDATGRVLGPLRAVWLREGERIVRVKDETGRVDGPGA